MIDDQIRSSVQNSTARMKQIVSEQLAGRLGSNQDCIGYNCTAGNILSAVSQINAGPDDAIFVYFIGYGAFGPGGHYFDFPGQDLPRQQLVSAMTRKGARLTVLISESCSVDPNADGLGMLAGAGMALTTPQTLTRLLTNYRGVIDVNSSSEGQYGFGNSSGGFFSRYFHAALEQDQANPSWQAIISQAGSEQSQLYQQIRQTELNKFANNPALLNDPKMVSLRDSLQRQNALTPAIYQMNVN